VPGDLDPVVEVRNDASGSDLTTVFRVKYVAEGVAYVDGGRSAGLAEGMKLEVAAGGAIVQQGASLDPGDPRVVAELEVIAVAETSAVAVLGSHTRKPVVGDVTYLSTADAAALLASRSLSPTRHYPAVVTFTEGDPLDEEVREEVPRPPLPSVNRARGRIGIDYVATVARGETDVRSSTSPRSGWCCGRTSPGSAVATGTSAGTGAAGAGRAPRRGRTPCGT
jgi:hypothetical protein